MSFNPLVVSPDLSIMLLRATLGAVVAWCVLRVVLAVLRIESPRAQRWAGWAVLVQGWMVAPLLVIGVPWYDPTDYVSRPPTLDAAAVAGESFDLVEAQEGSRDVATLGDRGSEGEFRGAATRTASAPRRNLVGYLRSLLPWLWGAGAVAAAGAFAISYARFAWRARQVSRRGAAADADSNVVRDAAEREAECEWREVLAEHGVRRAIPLRFSESIGPMLCLLPRGYELWVPRALWRELSAGQRAAVLRHELSHWRRGDVWKSWLAYVLALPQWFNPLAWSAVASIRQSGEWLADQDAADSASRRDDFLGALVRLAEIKTPESTAAGLGAHAHPLLVRVRRLLSPGSSKESNMKKFLFASLVVALALAPIVRFQLVARAADVPASLQAVKERMEQLDRKVADVKDAVEGLKKRGEELKESIGAKTKQVQALVEDPTKISDDLKKRVELFNSGDEQRQLEALKDIEKLASRDEVVLACGRVAKDSPHESVRRRALTAALSLGEDGYPAIAIAYEALGGKDRVFLAQELAKRNSPDNVVFFAFMTKDANDELLKTLLNLELPPSQRILFLSAIAEAQMNDAFYDHVVSVGSRMEGEPGLLMLYVMAKKGPEKQAAAAVEAAVKRKADAWPVIAAAYHNASKTTRTAVVRAAKQLGGEPGDFVLKTALAETDADLKAAAEEAAK